jgi:alkylation response protein AidB-like acyl-CoA dehydrogenase
MAGIEEYVTECSMMKIKGSEMLDYVVDESVQMYGGYGYIAEYPAERYYRDARVGRIYEGTNEINRMLTPGMLLKRALKGELPLIAAAKKLQDELLEMPSFDEDEATGPLTDEKKLVDNAKKVAVLMLGLAGQKFGDKLNDEQGVLGNIADIMIETYGMESAYLRTLKMVANRGEEESRTAIDMTRLYCNEAMGRIDLWSRELLAAASEGDELRTMLAAARRMVKYTPIDSLHLRLGIADHFIEKERYEL